MFALHTDRYQLSMLGSYIREGIVERPSVFELSMRKLPRNRRFLVMVGMDRALRFLQDLRFSEEQLSYLRAAPGLADVMTEGLLAYLRNFRFRGAVHGLAEGEVILSGSPVLRVEATLGEAQIIETFVLGVINHESKVASKAARVVLAAGGKPVFAADRQPVRLGEQRPGIEAIPGIRKRTGNGKLDVTLLQKLGDLGCRPAQKSQLETLERPHQLGQERDQEHNIYGNRQPDGQRRDCSRFDRRCELLGRLSTVEALLHHWQHAMAEIAQVRQVTLAAEQLSAELVLELLDGARQ